ncbi:MAG: GAF domain-containing protein [Deltaproteobacteria bacterium]|nr:GAF domain-containing protein [Deltaproteobacteria bacterium]
MILAEGFLGACKRITAVSLDKNLKFHQKLDRILSEAVACMGAKSGSIMLMKGRKTLEVVAATERSIIGLKQPLEERSPSTWVVKNRRPLYVRDIRRSDIFQKRFAHYLGSAFLLVPVLENGRVIGVLSVTDKMGEDLFSREERDVLLGFAGQVISALENQRLAESLRRKRSALQRTNRRLKKVEELKTDLFNMLIHDLKGPISEMVAALDILSYTLKDDNLEHVRTAQTGCDTLYRMVSNLLDIARLEENKLELVFEDIDPRDVIRESVARVFGLSRIKALEIRMDFPDSEDGASLRADRGMLLRAIQNLLCNAIQYSPDGGTMEAGFTYGGPEEIVFYVRDHGPGIPSEYHGIIFDKFKQLEKKGNGRIYTTGLGLAFCKMAVEAHGGKIRVDSDGRGGSCFSFSLPLGQRDARVTRRRVSHSARSMRPPS